MKKASKQPKVLLVDDDKALSDMYAAAFMRRGFTAYTAPGGRKGIEKYRLRKPDIVILDMMMPEGSGVEMLREIRKDMSRYTPVVMLTNLDSSHFVKEAALDEVDAYLVKAHHTPAEVVEKTVEVLRWKPREKAKTH